MLDFSSLKELKGDFQAFCRVHSIQYEAAPFVSGSFVVADTSSKDEPLVFVSDEFVRLTGFSREEAIGKKCKFLVGKDTDPEATTLIRKIVSSRQEGFVRIINYTKKGESFENRLFLAPLGKKHFLGCQTDWSRWYTISTTKQESNVLIVEAEKKGISVPNAEPFFFENSYVRHGGIFLKTVTYPNRDSRVEEYFAGKHNHRNYEVQLQFNFREEHRAMLEASTLYLVAYVDQPLELSESARKILALLIVPFFSKLGMYAGAGCGVTTEGRTPGFCGAVELVADRVVQGSEGVLGPAMLPATDFHKDLLRARKVNKNGNLKGVFLPGQLYTISFFSLYASLERWKALNIPFISGLNLSEILQQQTFRIALMAAPAIHAATCDTIHVQGTKLMDFEVMNHQVHFQAFCAAHRIVYEPSAYMTGCFVVADVSQRHEPLVFVSDSFVELTGYPREEILGRKCNFLQGAGTESKSVEAIRHIVQHRQEGFVKIVNYTKSGQCFKNRLYLYPLGDTFYVGCQCGWPTEIVSTATFEQRSKILLIERQSGVVTKPNETPCHFDTQYLLGGGLYVKTVTHPQRDPRVEPYFANKRRMYEIQVQFQLREEHRDLFEKSTLYLAAYLEDPLQLGYVSYGILKTLVTFFSKLGSAENAITMGDEAPGLKPAFVGPLGVAADRVVQGPEGTLGVYMLPETAFQKEARAKKGKGTFKTGEVYTVSFHSMYIDFERYVMVGVPGLSQMDLRRFWANQPIKFAIMALPLSSAGAKYLFLDGIKLLDLEIVHEEVHAGAYKEALIGLEVYLYGKVFK